MIIRVRHERVKKRVDEVVGHVLVSGGEYKGKREGWSAPHTMKFCPGESV